MTTSRDISAVLVEWAKHEDSIKALVLFGSRARATGAAAAADGWSDVDLQVVTSSPRLFEDRSWVDALPGLELCLYVIRPASGGVRKATLIFSSGEADLVIVPERYLRRLRSAGRAGLYRRQPKLGYALNELSTIMGGGYRMLKGGKQWGGFYAWAVEKIPGQRLGDPQTGRMADVFLCDLLWVLQRIARGELVAAQRSLHRLLAETNFQLMHEARLRRNALTYREARRVERLLPSRELALLRVSARLNRAELNRSARHAYRSFCTLMAGVDPAWSVPAPFAKLLAPYLGR